MRQPRSVPFSPARNTGGTGLFLIPLRLQGPRRSNWRSTAPSEMRSGRVLRRSWLVRGEERGEWQGSLSVVRRGGATFLKDCPFFTISPTQATNPPSRHPPATPHNHITPVFFC